LLNSKLSQIDFSERKSIISPRYIRGLILSTFVAVQTRPQVRMDLRPATEEGIRTAQTQCITRSPIITQYHGHCVVTEVPRVKPGVSWAKKDG
jgi:hypothetical protein